MKVVFYGGDGRRLGPAEYVDNEGDAKKMAVRMEDNGTHVEAIRLRHQPFNLHENDQHFVRSGPMGRFARTSKEQFVKWQREARRD